MDQSSSRRERRGKDSEGRKNLTDSQEGMCVSVRRASASCIMSGGVVDTDWGWSRK